MAVHLACRGGVVAEAALAIDQPVADDEGNGTGHLADAGREIAPFLGAEFTFNEHADAADGDFGVGEFER